jgi:hypothetical protein
MRASRPVGGRIVVSSPDRAYRLGSPWQARAHQRPGWWVACVRDVGRHWDLIDAQILPQDLPGAQAREDPAEDQPGFASWVRGAPIADRDVVPRRTLASLRERTGRVPSTSVIPRDASVEQKLVTPWVVTGLLSTMPLNSTPSRGASVEASIALGRGVFGPPSPTEAVMSACMMSMAMRCRRMRRM